MKSNKNVLDELWDMDPDATQTQIRNTLASFLFTQDEVFKEVNDLSGGERVRLALAKLMLEHDNVLFWMNLQTIWIFRLKKLWSPL